MKCDIDEITAQHSCTDTIKQINERNKRHIDDTNMNYFINLLFQIIYKLTGAIKKQQ